MYGKTKIRNLILAMRLLAADLERGLIAEKIEYNLILLSKKKKLNKSNQKPKRIK